MSSCAMSSCILSSCVTKMQKIVANLGGRNDKIGDVQLRLTASLSSRSATCGLHLQAALISCRTACMLGCSKIKGVVTCCQLAAARACKCSTDVNFVMRDAMVLRQLRGYWSGNVWVCHGVAFSDVNLPMYVCCRMTVLRPSSSLVTCRMLTITTVTAPVSVMGTSPDGTLGVR